MEFVSSLESSILDNSKLYASGRALASHSLQSDIL